MQAEVISDGRTVWVNGEDGCCFARFSRFDVHNTAKGQVEGGLCWIASRNLIGNDSKQRVWSIMGL